MEVVDLDEPDCIRRRLDRSHSPTQVATAESDPTDACVGSPCRHERANESLDLRFDNGWIVVVKMNDDVVGPGTVLQRLEANAERSGGPEVRTGIQVDDWDARRGACVERFTQRGVAGVVDNVDTIETQRLSVKDVEIIERNL
ncbi:MAG: hypothetical protein ACJA14_000042 [Ilumatobacter sp.]